jgi:hypothetical protein
MHYLKYLYPLLDEVGSSTAGGDDNTAADIAAKLSSPDNGDSDEPDNDSDDDDSSNTKDDKNKPPVVADDFKPSPIWDVFKSNAEFKLPEGLNKDNESELLEAQLKAKYGSSNEDLHPLAKQINELAKQNPNLSINDLVNDVQSDFIDISKMSVEERISFHLKNIYGDYDEENNKDGMTDDDIKEYIGKLTKVEKNELSRQIEESVNAYNQKIIADYEEKQKESFAANYDKVIAENEKFVTEIKNKISSVDKIFGIPVSQEDHEAYLEEFKQFITPNKETGIRNIDLVLSDDVNLYKIFVALVKNGEGKVLETITKGRESTKEELFKKLGISPNFSSSRDKSDRMDDPESIVNALSQPER